MSLNRSKGKIAPPRMTDPLTTQDGSGRDDRIRPSNDLGERLYARFDRTIVVTPPFVFDSESGVTALDIVLAGQPSKRASGRAAICFGDHPPPNASSNITGSGADHEIVVAIDPTPPRHHTFPVSSPRQSQVGKAYTCHRITAGDDPPPEEGTRILSVPPTALVLPPSTRGGSGPISRARPLPHHAPENLMSLTIECVDTQLIRWSLW